VIHGCSILRPVFFKEKAKRQQALRPYSGKADGTSAGETMHRTALDVFL